MYHKVKGVMPLPNYRLEVIFSEGVIKIYDVASLFDKYKFLEPLRTSIKLFYSVCVDPHGLGVIWNDDIDIYCEELWANGVEEKVNA